ncbi:hypothetical protein DFH09DRAFT_1363766 [Mycena vulgaris]|nr:hypothetical protein DFH09DRAFT_1363766 [Mycena vulgaris]
MLNNKHLKALCEKYTVDTARANADMPSEYTANSNLNSFTRLRSPQPAERVRRHCAPAHALRAPPLREHAAAVVRALVLLARGRRHAAARAHLPGSTSDLLLTGTISHVTQLASSASSRTAIRASTSRKAEASTRKRRQRGRQNLAAVCYLFDGDAAPDRSAEPIWLLCVQLPGWGLEDEARMAAAANTRLLDTTHHHLPTLGHSTPRHAASISTGNSTSASHSTLHPTHAEDGADDTAISEDDAGPWPVAFRAAFYAQVWCTYRAGFEPIHDLLGLGALPAEGGDAGVARFPARSTPAPPPPPPPRLLHPHLALSLVRHLGIDIKQRRHQEAVVALPSLGVGGTKGWTSDAGFGCMLRTGRVCWRVVAGADALET